MVLLPGFPVGDGGEAQQVELVVFLIVPGAEAADLAGANGIDQLGVGTEHLLDEAFQLSEVHGPFIPVGDLSAILGDGFSCVVFPSPVFGQGCQQV